ncbi:DUF1566 domain-containing protein [Leptospira sp. FAT2]|uniref:Lcl C-terminal domain-containing protein n=1 Tax=Leptospira sanjuanensis TaxID=2879643 RepID=UPI001EE7F1F9|nr:DUF1566 domain-containing protein [Leptospira sanjuanensis]MCG6167181.1 DUF1566 domain-containing protein [Leptospira sanjuanensis]MCG6192640.1 DUF1566 domain-containing protein [Leptospira sanjuanensis]
MKLLFKSLIFCFCLIGQVMATPSRYTDKEDGTVLDTRTGLVWQLCPAGLGSENSTTKRSTCGIPTTGNTNGSPIAYNWRDALNYCKGILPLKKPPVLPAGKFWRLPNINELKSIVDRSQMNPAMDTSKLIGGGVDLFWSSTSVASDSTAAWTVNFFFGTSYGSSDKDFGYYVRCVSN